MGCWYLTVAHVGQLFSSLLQVTQTQVNRPVGVAGHLAAVLVTWARSGQTLVLRTVVGVAQADAVLWDASTNTNIFMGVQLYQQPGLNLTTTTILGTILGLQLLNESRQVRTFGP